MPEWKTVQVTGACSGTPDNRVLLPQGTEPQSRLLIESTSGKRWLITGGLRTDRGEGACVSGATLQRLGGERASVKYRAATTLDTLRYRPWTLVQAIVSILTFVGVLITAWAGFLKSNDPTGEGFVYQTAAVALFIAVVGAVSKLWKELRAE